MAHFLQYFYKMGQSWPLFFFNFVYSIQFTNVQYKFLSMTGFELQPLVSEATALPTDAQPLPSF